MYREGAEIITKKGLSPFLRWFLGIVSLLFGIVMLLAAPSAPKPMLLSLIGVFCIAIFLACVLKGRLRQFVGSCIGLCVFSIAIWYVYSQVSSGPLYSSSRSESSVVNSLLFLFFFGFPSIAYVFKTKFGLQREKP